jgi:hypothetical protein
VWKDFVINSNNKLTRIEMDTNNNNEIKTETKKNTGFWHGGWSYFIFLVLIVGIMVGISYLVKVLL